MISFKPEGICAKEINFEVKDGFITKVSFSQGCNGNLQGLAALLEGMEVSEVVKRLKGINCGGRGTSCPDQLVQALQGYATKQGE